MLTIPRLSLAVRSRFDAASDRGPRKINADAVASHADEATGWVAFVVADGVGDHLLAARAARLSARAAATAAVRHGAHGGVLSAQRELLREFDQQQADAVLVVAVLPPADSTEEVVDIAWVGDCRAYRWNGRVLHQITVDHTLAQFWRTRDAAPSPRMEHVVTESVRTTTSSAIGRASTGTGRLLLSTDGVHKQLDLVGIRRILADDMSAGETAKALISAARTLGSTDNATAVVLDHILA